MKLCCRHRACRVKPSEPAAAVVLLVVSCQVVCTRTRLGALLPSVGMLQATTSKQSLMPLSSRLVAVRHAASSMLDDSVLSCMQGGRWGSGRQECLLQMVTCKALLGGWQTDAAQDGAGTPHCIGQEWGLGRRSDGIRGQAHQGVTWAHLHWSSQAITSAPVPVGFQAPCELLASARTARCGLVVANQAQNAS